LVSATGNASYANQSVNTNSTGQLRSRNRPQVIASLGNNDFIIQHLPLHGREASRIASINTVQQPSFQLTTEFSLTLPLTKIQLTYISKLPIISYQICKFNLLSAS